jgi:hypothetical protein
MQQLCKQRPLLGNARNNRTTMLCIPFLSNGSVNTLTSTEALLQEVFFIGSVLVIKESTVENRHSSSKLAVSLNLGSEREAETWRYEFRYGMLTSGQRHDHGSRRISTVLNLLPGNG